MERCEELVINREESLVDPNIIQVDIYTMGDATNFIPFALSQYGSCKNKNDSLIDYLEDQKDSNNR